MKAVIFGAGYAGLFAAYELEKHNQEYIVLEKNNEPGGLSRTFKLDNLNFDIGPHIYFNKQEEIRNIWKELIEDKLITIKRHNKIFYDGTYINSPLKPFNAISKLERFKTYNSIRIRNCTIIIFIASLNLINKFHSFYNFSKYSILSI